MRSRLLLSLVLLGGCSPEPPEPPAADWDTTVNLGLAPSFALGAPTSENPAGIYAQLFGAALLDQSIVYGNELGQLVRVSLEGDEIWRVLGLGDGPDEVDAGLNPTVHTGLITASGGRGTRVSLDFEGTVHSIQKGLPESLTADRLYPKEGLAAASDGSWYYFVGPPGRPVEDPQPLVRQIGDSFEVLKEFAPVEITEQPSPGEGGPWRWTGVHMVGARDETLILYRRGSDFLEVTGLNLEPISEIRPEKGSGNALLDQCGRVWISLGQLPDRRLQVFSRTGEPLLQVTGPENTGSPLDAARGRVLFPINDPEYSHAYMGVWENEALNLGCGTD